MKAGNQANQASVKQQRRRIADVATVKRDISLNGEEAGDDHVLGREALDVATNWAIIGIFLIMGFAIVHYMALILIPITLAIVVGLILGVVADKMGNAGVPRFGIALILSSLVFALLFLIINSLAEPIGTLVQEGPSFVERTINRFMPILQSQRWLNISPATFQTGPMSMESLLQNSTNILGVLTASLTPAIIQAMIFFGALVFFLYGRLHLRRAIIMAFPRRHQRLMTIRVFNSIDSVLGYYFATASMLYIGLGVAMTIIAYLSGLSMPLMWGMFAFISSFIPYLGITVMTLSVAIAGILTHDTIALALIPAAVFFLLHLAMENLVFPAIMGRQWEINPFVVFLAILFWTWMWGAVGAMLALPLSLIMMTIINELFPEQKNTPHLPG